MVLGSAIALTPGLAIGNPLQEKKDLFTSELILDFVFAAHKSLETTKKILEEHPLLLNCTSQFTKGDFETAVGGASHMGRKDIATYLVSKGARLDIFNLAFLGFDDIVKQMITEHPHLLYAPGPHGFNLLHHAQVGKHAELVAWLQSKGLKKARFEGVFG